MKHRIMSFCALVLALPGTVSKTQSPSISNSSIQSQPAVAFVYKQLHNFVWTKDGCCALNPDSLAEGIDGNVYGTLPSQLGGYGTVISYSPTSGIFSTVYNFQKNDGYSPQSGLNLGVDGNLYGTTEWGGPGTSTGYGTVFRVGNGSVTDLHIFTNGADGAYPWAAPVQTVDGTLYGVTYNGATQGTAYSISPAGVFKTLASLPSKTQAPLIVGTDGNLYGTTQYGGTSNRGTVFKMSPTGAITILHSFDPTSHPNNGTQYDGSIPVGPLIQGTDGKFYGTTNVGGNYALGIVFQISPTGAYQVLHSFKNSTSTTPIVTEGANPVAGMVDGGNGYIYGVAEQGGVSGYGTLFRLTKTGTSFSVLHNFDKQTGGNPYGTLLLHTNGSIYGVTYTGGTNDPTKGVLYQFSAGLTPFALIVGPTSGPVGSEIGLVGQGFTSKSTVYFGSSTVPASGSSIQIVSSTSMLIKVPQGAKSGMIKVVTPSATLLTRQSFTVKP